MGHLSIGVLTIAKVIEMVNVITLGIFIICKEDSSCWPSALNNQIACGGLYV